MWFCVFTLLTLSLFSGLFRVIDLPGSNGARKQVVSQKASQDPPELLEARQLSEASVRLYNEGKYKDALKPAKRALEICERGLRADDRRVLDAINNLAAIQMALNNFKDSEKLYKRVLAAVSSAEDFKGLQAANAWDSLAWLHYAMGDARQAEADYHEALALREKSAGLHSREVAQTLIKLAQLNQFHGELKKAEILYQRLIAFDENSFPEAKAIVSDARNDYSCLLRKMKKANPAEELEKQVEGLATNSKVPGFVPTAQEGVLNGKALRLLRPPYPPEARFNNASGIVEVRVTIDEQGKVVHACAQKGHRLLWQASERAAYGSEFSPTLLEGKPVKVTGIITYNFVRLN